MANFGTINLWLNHIMAVFSYIFGKKTLKIEGKNILCYKKVLGMLTQHENLWKNQRNDNLSWKLKWRWFFSQMAKRKPLYSWMRHNWSWGPFANDKIIHCDLKCTILLCNLLFGLAKARLKFSQKWSLNLLSNTHHHRNF